MQEGPGRMGGARWGEGGGGAVPQPLPTFQLAHSNIKTY